jgi:hypothetical protein
VRGELAAGLGWIPMWAVVRTHLVALYKSHEAACTDAEKTELRPIKFSGIRKVTVGSDADTLAGRKSAIVIENAKKHYFFSTHLDQGPQGGEANHFTRTPEKEEEEKENWVNLIETLVQFQMPERVRREKESDEKKKEKEKAKKEKKEGEKKDEKKH